jgi:hypothetical protein
VSAAVAIAAPAASATRDATAAAAAPAAYGTPLPRRADAASEAEPLGLRLTETVSTLDFILDLSHAPLPAWLINEPRHGAWSFHFGDFRRDRGEHSDFWQRYDGDGKAMARLVRLTTDPNSVIVLREGCLRITKHSYRARFDQLLTRFTHWPAQVCMDIAHGEVEQATATALQSDAPARDAPGDFTALLFIAKTAFRIFRSILKDLFQHEQWNVGVIKQPIATLLEGGRTPRIEWLPKLKRTEFLADCFGVMRDGQPLLLCEYLDQNDGRGVIVSTETGAKSKLVPVDIGPVPSVHLSYPFLLEVDGKILCIPETHEAREVGLYEPEVFPHRWTKIATLLSGVMVVDATVFRHDDLWWLAASEVAAKGTNCELHLWYADELMGPWRPHAQNPVKTDVRSARPGGTPFVHSGALYRPAQDCSKTYGGRIVINRVTRLSPLSFKEEVVTAVNPDERGLYPHGMHTLSAVGNLTVVDGKRRLFVPQEFMRVVRWALRGAKGSAS